MSVDPQGPSLMLWQGPIRVQPDRGLRSGVVILTMADGTAAVVEIDPEDPERSLTAWLRAREVGSGSRMVEPARRVQIAPPDWRTVLGKTEVWET